MLQCNRYPGLDANEIIRLTSAIGHLPPFVCAHQRSFKWQLRSDNCLVTYRCLNSTPADV